MPFHFGNVLLFSATAVLFGGGSLVAGHFLRPHAPTREKSMIYECGEKPIGQAWFNFNPRFYLIALVFVIFEVEIAFMYPVASVYKAFIEKGQGLLAFWAIGSGSRASSRTCSSPSATPVKRPSRPPPRKRQPRDAQELPAGLRLHHHQQDLVHRRDHQPGAQEQHLLPALRPGLLWHR